MRRESRPNRVRNQGLLTRGDGQVLAVDAGGVDGEQVEIRHALLEGAVQVGRTGRQCPPGPSRRAGRGRERCVRAGVDDQAQLGPAVRLQGEPPAQGARGAAVRGLAHGVGCGRALDDGPGVPLVPAVVEPHASLHRLDGVLGVRPLVRPPVGAECEEVGEVGVGGELQLGGHRLGRLLTKVSRSVRAPPVTLWSRNTV